MKCWKETSSIPILSRPTLRCNNLSWSSSGRFAYVQRSKVVVVSGSKGQKTATIPARDQSSVIYSARFVLISDMVEYLVVSLSTSIEVWSECGTRLLCQFGWNDYETEKTNDTELNRRFTAISGVIGSPILVLGTSTGEVLLCHCDGRRIDFEDKLCQHEDSITDIATSPSYTVSGDESGLVCAWNHDSRDLQVQFKGQGFPCTSVATKGDIIVAGYENGLVRVFKISARRLNYEFDAHCRSVSAVGIHPRNNLLLSAGEDTFVNIWKLPSKQNPKVQIESSVHVPNCIITGAQFTTQGTSSFAVAGYDCKEIKIFSE